MQKDSMSGFQCMTFLHQRGHYCTFVLKSFAVFCVAVNIKKAKKKEKHKHKNGFKKCVKTWPLKWDSCPIFLWNCKLLQTVGRPECSSLMMPKFFCSTWGETEAVWNKRGIMNHASGTAWEACLAQDQLNLKANIRLHLCDTRHLQKIKPK